MNVDLVRSLFDYEPETGVLRWRVKSGNGVQVGDVAGGLSGTGYRCVTCRGRHYQSHRLIWLHVHGAWPTLEIDHIDGDKDNNRIANLRDIARGPNQQNQKRAYKGSASGVLGVESSGSKFRARLRFNGKQQHLGNYETAEEAHAAYLAAKKSFHLGYVGDA